MTTREVVREHGSNIDAATTAAIKETGCTRDHARRLWREEHPSPAEVRQINPKSKAGGSLDAFKQAHDKDTIVRRKILAALTALGSAWEYEGDFVRRAGVSYNDLGNYRAEYEGYWVQIKREGKRVWAGTEEFASQLRELV